MSRGGTGQVQAALQDLIATGLLRGFLTYDEITRTIPPQHISSDEIEDVMARLMELGIAVIDNDGPADDGAERR